MMDKILFSFDQLSLQIINPLTNPQDVIELRSRVLRPGQDISLCQFKEDFDVNTFHLGIFHQSQIVCSGTFMQQEHPDFPNAKKPYRLRGMATDFTWQGKNLGSILIQSSLYLLKKHQCDFLWFNARETAFQFYLNNGFKFYGEMFDIPLIGPHKVMYKWILTR